MRESLMNPEQKVSDESSDADAKPAPQPDAETDRSAPLETPRKGGPVQEPRKPPLEIREIEQIEDDAPGG
jgi:hypothetical protein